MQVLVGYVLLSKIGDRVPKFGRHIIEIERMPSSIQEIETCENKINGDSRDRVVILGFSPLSLELRETCTPDPQKKPEKGWKESTRFRW